MDNAVKHILVIGISFVLLAYLVGGNLAEERADERIAALEKKAAEYGSQRAQLISQRRSLEDLKESLAARLLLETELAAEKRLKDALGRNALAEKSGFIELQAALAKKEEELIAKRNAALSSASSAAATISSTSLSYDAPTSSSEPAAIPVPAQAPVPSPSPAPADATTGAS